MPAKSPQPTPGREDEALARARTKTPAFSTMASIRKSLITPSPAGTTATEAMTPMTVSPDPPDSISFRTSSQQEPVPDDVRQSQDADCDDDVRTPTDGEWRIRTLFIGDKDSGRAHRRTRSFQDSETPLPDLPPRKSLRSHGESDSSVPVTSSAARKSRRRKSRSTISRSSKSLSSDEWPNDYGMTERRRSSSTTNIVSPDGIKTPSVETPTTSSSSEGSPDSSPTRQSTIRRKASSRVTSPVPDEKASCLQSCRLGRLRTRGHMFTLLLVGFLSLGFTVITNRAVIKVEEVIDTNELEDVISRQYEEMKGSSHARSKKPPAAGLRGSIVRKPGGNRHNHKKKDDKKKKGDDKKKYEMKDPITDKKDEKLEKLLQEESKRKATNMAATATTSDKKAFGVAAPTKKLKIKQAFNSVDHKMFDPDAKSKAKPARVLYLHDSIIEKSGPVSRNVQVYPSDFTDNTQLYGVLDSDDERLSRMELREPYADDQCVPMQEWQTTFHPSCNGMHEMALDHMGSDTDNDFHLFGTKGFWRNAWKVDVLGSHHHSEDRETVVLKTLKFEHRFEDAHFEHDRIDAVAMERLTSSPHVINVFGFCGHSVVTEYAEGTRVGSLADKSKKTPLARLKIARDIANGLADVHGIDGDAEGNSTFVHLDINPANVVSIGGTLKLNDFNIGIIRRWNVTSQKPCGFPAQYPNPQWRSPEEARNQQDLTEKVDIFSMGHILFRLVCGHEPWNKLEPSGRLIKEEVNEKVKKGVLPTIPEEVINSTDEEVIAIRDAMLRCYSEDPSKRPSAREIANTFQEILDRLSSE